MGVLGGYECPFSVFDGRATAYARNLQKLNEYMMAFTASLPLPTQSYVQNIFPGEQIQPHMHSSVWLYRV